MGQSIASTLNTVRINEQNLGLLEQFQRQAEQKAAQEEEIRQNLEELRYLREKLKKEEELNNDKM